MIVDYSHIAVGCVPIYSVYKFLDNCARNRDLTNCILIGTSHMLDGFETEDITNPVMPPKRKSQSKRRKAGSGKTPTFTNPMNGERVSTVQRVKRMAALWDYVQYPGVAGVNDTFGVRLFRYNDLAQYGDFSVAFRFYRIEHIEVQYIPLRNSSLIETSTQRPSLPVILTIADFVDGTKPTATQYLMANQTVKCHSADRSFRRVLKPCYATTVYRSSTASGYAPGRGWIETSYGDVPWYGFKWSATFENAGSTVANAGLWQFTFTVDLAMMI